MSDQDIDHGFVHDDHMGTEAWRCEQVRRIEAALDAQEAEVE